MPIRPVLCAVFAVVLTVAACSTPISLDEVGAQAVHEELSRNVLTTGEPSVDSVLAIRRADLEDMYASDPLQALANLHFVAHETDTRDRMFALAELSMHQATLTKDRDQNLAAAVYAYHFLFDDKATAPSPFDSRFRVACDIYNLALARGFANEDGEFVMTAGERALPIGLLVVSTHRDGFPWDEARFDRFVPSLDYAVDGLRARTRTTGLGATLLGGSSQGVEQHEFAEYMPLGIKVPATAFLRVMGSFLDHSGDEPVKARLELYYPAYVQDLLVNGQPVQLETDITAPLAATLEDSGFYDFEFSEFFSSDNTEFENRLFMLEPYQRHKRPVVFVHGTASSPARWAEMFNELQSDRELGTEFQYWFFMYSTGNPILYSAASLRNALQGALIELDPEGTDENLQKMIVVGHSQGGLLTRLLVTDSGDAFWRQYADTPIDDLDVSNEEREKLREVLFHTPQSFVERVIFIATPHQGSFMAGGPLGKLASMLISLPAETFQLPAHVADAMSSEPFEDLPTAVENMDPDHPFVQTLSALPITVPAHSIVAIDGDEDPPEGDDGVVEYTSAHLESSSSELIVRSFHSVQDHPRAVEEVRRILHDILDAERAASASD